MTSVLAKTYRASIGICWLLAWLALIGLTVAVCVGVADRFIFKVGYAWPEAVGRVLLIWLALMGSVVAAARRAHFSAGVIPPGTPAARRVELLIRVISALALLCLAISGYEVMEIVGGQEMAGIEISIIWIYIPLPIACLLMAVSSLLHGISGEEHG